MSLVFGPHRASIRGLSRSGLEYGTAYFIRTFPLPLSENVVGLSLASFKHYASKDPYGHKGKKERRGLVGRLLYRLSSSPFCLNFSPRAVSRFRFAFQRGRGHRRGRRESEFFSNMTRDPPLPFFSLEEI